MAGIEVAVQRAFNGHSSQASPDAVQVPARPYRFLADVTEAFTNRIQPIFGRIDLQQTDLVRPQTPRIAYRRSRHFGNPNAPFLPPRGPAAPDLDRGFAESFRNSLRKRRSLLIW